MPEPQEPHRLQPFQVYKVEFEFGNFAHENRISLISSRRSSGVVMCRAWLGSKAWAWAWLTWAQACSKHEPSPGRGLGPGSAFRPGLGSGPGIIGRKCQGKDTPHLPSTTSMLSRLCMVLHYLAPVPTLSCPDSELDLTPSLPSVSLL